MRDQRRFYMPVFRLLLVGVGIAGDVIAGLAMLQHQVLQGMTLHLSATLLWIVGVVILGVRRPAGTDVVEQNQSLLGKLATRCLINPADAHSGQITATFALGLILFPGLGPLGCTLAFGLADFLGRPKPMTANRQTEPAASDLLLEIGRVVKSTAEPRGEVDIQPLVEVLAKPDCNMKRRALEMICREPGSRAMSMARHVLTDPDPDIRALAAVAVGRMEAHFSEQLKASVARLESRPQTAEYHGAVGSLYYQYASHGSTDVANRHFYLAQARKSFDSAVSLDPTRHDYFRCLAEVLLGLGEAQAASQAAAKVLAGRPGDSAGYLLAMEIALRQRRLDKIALLAERACQRLAINDPVLPLMNWWLQAIPRPEAERS